MNDNKTPSIYKDNFVSLVLRCSARNILTDDYESFVNNYLLRSFNEIKYFKLPELDMNDFVEIQTISDNYQDVKLEAIEFLENALPYLFSRINTMLSKAEKIKLEMPKRKRKTISNIFQGLQWEGNNDDNYEDIPSSLVLSTFNL